MICEVGICFSLSFSLTLLTKRTRSIYEKIDIAQYNNTTLQQINVARLRKWSTQHVSLYGKA